MKMDEFVLENWLNPACDSEKNKVYLGGRDRKSVV